MPFNTIPEILEDFRQGRMVVILDDEDRENEGDIVMAAEKVRPEDVNFMVREARGLLCLTLTEKHTRQLGLKPMVSDNNSPYHTNFTVSIEAAEGVTTGISAHDRARTIQVAAAADAKPADITMPGHIFPLTAQAGGVLSRAGHTEAGCDLATLAGMQPSSVLIEILHDDGSMARRPELEIFAAKHGLKIGTIADLIRYRLETEKTIERVHEEDVDTEFGPFKLVAYRDGIRRGLHFALVRGDVANGEPVLTRVHVRNTLSDVLHLKRDDLGQTVTEALRKIDAEQRGVLVVLSGEDTPDALLARLRRDVAPMPAPKDDQEWRQTGLGAQILADLGVKRLRVIGTPRKLVGIAGFGLEVVEQAG
ncbi:3,4-dihydroxy-2-butanone-4-phosphate synthase [Luteibacter rhizovicinus DSM 16549]|uniref:3,4-dihydroxy-2-butanone 4-phosphate synthase n=1 Tax=Luteibacter rhizovicinus DSM 16549 TaxID=1440763 RepID=A0A0G9H1C8_9GAMM|nr:3,4-dihydroxy-2-butanone-4-phosphate synthase [Luteibacter rhizovicinus]APG02967.1 3,4-dihydroxy-2-butanone-4-phosphate synthase [Luteibacter rhizovicinus DSM 16549]KLD63358.1 3,4-dihydroxy-2-butanone 4-phosphate synthase [Luteibacter rhizovicinus DSM 16549]KLD76599.1 3,4-dihydroxy-2-butanone 4-phosphate synthase [Xanthomonas hyacinthi DSM 19077]